MRLLIFILEMLESLETAVRWLYCNTVFTWQTRRELNRLFDEDRR